MNYTKSNFSMRKSLAIDSNSVAPSPKKIKRSIPYRAVAPIAMLIDAFAILAMSIVGGVAYHIFAMEEPGRTLQYFGLGAIVAALFVGLGKSTALYSVPELVNLKTQIHKLTTKWVAIFAFLSAVAFMMKIGENVSRGATISFAVTGLAILIATRFIWKAILADGSAVSKLSGRRVALVVEQPNSLLCDALVSQGSRLTHQFVIPKSKNQSQAWKDAILQIATSLRGSNVEEVVVAADAGHWSELSGLLSNLKILPVPVNFVPLGPISDLFLLPSHMLGNTTVIEFQRGSQTLFEQFAKRMIDIIVAGAAIVLLLPLFLMTAVAIKLDSSGPVIFRQRRSGFNGAPFNILKFRTMSVLEDGETIEQAKVNDARVTYVGNWLRRTSIDELPQLLNVLEGTMSIVGPRPHALAHDANFNTQVGRYAFRYHLKPGITGWAQIHGFRGRTGTVNEIEKRVEHDLWYIENWSLALDLKIIFMTAIEIVRGKNAY